MLSSKPFVSIIIPHYNNDISILKKVLERSVNQDYKNKEVILVIDNPNKKKSIIPQTLRKKIKIIKNQKNLGLAGSLNRGIKEAKGEIIITLLEDCVPSDNKWLEYLVKPFENPEVVAVASKLKDDRLIFRKFDLLVKDLMQDKQKEYSPRLGERGCAFRKKNLEEVGLFDSAHFKTAGEDWDMYYKLSEKGRVILGSNSIIIHIHPINLKGFYKKSAIYANSAGVLFRIYGFRFMRFKEFLKLLFPLWGIAKGIKTPATYSKNKLKLIKVYVKLNWIHLVNFIPFFIKGKQE